MRFLYQLLRYLGDAKALSRSPGAYVQRRTRASGHRHLARALRSILKP